MIRSNSSSISKLQEGLIVKGKITCDAYTNCTLTARLYYRIGSGSWRLIDASTYSIGNNISNGK